MAEGGFSLGSFKDDQLTCMFGLVYKPHYHAIIPLFVSLKCIQPLPIIIMTVD